MVAARNRPRGKGRAWRPPAAQARSELHAPCPGVRCRTRDHPQDDAIPRRTRTRARTVHGRGVFVLLTERAVQDNESPDCSPQGKGGVASREHPARPRRSPRPREGVEKPRHVSRDGVRTGTERQAVHAWSGGLGLRWNERFFGRPHEPWTPASLSRPRPRRGPGPGRREVRCRRSPRTWSPGTPRYRRCRPRGPGRSASPRRREPPGWRRHPG